MPLHHPPFAATFLAGFLFLLSPASNGLRTQEDSTAASAAGVFHAPYVGMVVATPMHDPARAVGAHILWDRESGPSFGTKVEGRWRGARDPIRDAGADVLFPMRKGPGQSVFLGTLGILWAGDATEVTVGLGGKGLNLGSSPDPTAPAPPEILFFLDARGGPAREKTSIGRIWIGTGTVEVMMALPMRISPYPRARPAGVAGGGY